MASTPKIPGKPRSPVKGAPISLKDELDIEETAAEPVTIELTASAVEPDDEAEARPIIVERVAPEPVEPPKLQAAVAVSVLAPPLSQASGARELDPGEWSLKTLDAFNETATAVLDLAVALGRAESVSDAIELQSRFASERYATLVRQTSDFVELTRRLALAASAPFRSSISVFIA